MSVNLSARDAAGGSEDPSSSRAGRVLALLLLGALFPAVAFWLPPVLAVRTGYEHALLDLGIALSACFCSLQALVRYQSRPQPLFLWLGAGFLASGLLDGLHAMLSLEAFPVAGGEDRTGAWTWTASSVVLATYIVLSLRRERPAGSERATNVHAAVVGGTTLAVLVALAFALLVAPLRPAVFAGALHRPYELVPAAIMVAAMAILWRRRALLDPALRRRLGGALVVYASLHAGVMAWSMLPLDMFVGVSHLAKLLGHWLVLVGLLQSSANLLTEAEGGRRLLAAQAQELEASERHIRTIVDHAPFAILGADAGGIVRSFNPVAEQLFGLPRRLAIGRPLQDFFDDEVRADLAATLGPRPAEPARDADAADDTTRSRRALSRETRGMRVDGETFPIALTLTDAVAGGQRFFTAFVRDLTTAIEQEQRTRQALTLATRILDQSSVAICSTDRAGFITRFNRTAQQWLGYAEHQVVGRLTPAAFLDRAELQRHARLLEREHGVASAADAEVVLALARRGATVQNEWTLVRRDGTRFPASVSVAPLAADAGEISGFVLVATDLSHQKEVDKLKNEFVSTVSHELRTPLTSVRGSLGLIAGGLAGKLPPQAQALLDIAQRNTERLILLINDILDIEKIEAGKLRFTFKSVDLDALVGDALQSAEGLAATRQVRLVRRARAPGALVYADDHRVMQVLSNLLSNAIKFSPEGGSVEVDVALDLDRARVTVTDHGPGIPEPSQGRIFQKFFQADSTSAREKGGTGLGLAICKALVERMDGVIGFRSRPGETVFHFELPLEAAHAPAPATAAARALVVEDDPDAAAVLAQILRQAGLESEVARTAQAAREQLGKRRYECVLLDILLPDQNGLALLAELRRLEHGRDVPVIVVSIYEPDAEAQAAAAAGRVAEWLTKPIDSRRLLAAVGRVVQPRARDGLLLVEDDLAMGELLRRLLAEVAPVTVARTVAEGRAQIEQRRFGLVLLDLNLPDGIGSELLPVLDAAQPETPIVVFSERERAAELRGKVARVLSKSQTSNDELLRIVQELALPADDPGARR